MQLTATIVTHMLKWIGLDAKGDVISLLGFLGLVAVIGFWWVGTP